MGHRQPRILFSFTSQHQLYTTPPPPDQLSLSSVVLLRQPVHVHQIPPDYGHSNCPQRPSCIEKDSYDDCPLNSLHSRLTCHIISPSVHQPSEHITSPLGHEIYANSRPIPFIFAHDHESLLHWTWIWRTCKKPLNKITSPMYTTVIITSHTLGRLWHGLGSLAKAQQ